MDIAGELIMAIVVILLALPCLSRDLWHEVWADRRRRWAGVLGLLVVGLLELCGWVGLAHAGARIWHAI